MDRENSLVERLFYCGPLLLAGETWGESAGGARELGGVGRTRWGEAKTEAGGRLEHSNGEQEDLEPLLCRYSQGRVWERLLLRQQRQVEQQSAVQELKIANKPRGPSSLPAPPGGTSRWTQGIPRCSLRQLPSSSRVTRGAWRENRQRAWRA